ncbi:erythroblast NAD(P)(+)--arginine ADP-ribosyltransferase-like [Sylvia atricapilla]|uniref:erythroblast NAD(P)(+)--arginine ADP-ribosyltransferase-like n=1 Tax=Sylvia atricapilla TaxID=48155 RepID=UPI003397F131
MAPLAHTLALLAMAVATVAIEVVPLDLAKSSFDDQYLKCSVTIKSQELQDSDFLKNEKFKYGWKIARERWKERGSVSYPLTPDQAIALLAYTMRETDLYRRFNEAVRTAGKSSWEYWNEFHFKSLHLLLTQALQKLRRPNDCKNVFRGVRNYHFDAKQGYEVCFGQFTSTSLNENVAQDFGQATMFKVRTCHGVDIQRFSMYPKEEEVLIPPFEIFKVIGVSKSWNTMHIELQSTGNSSNYDCEWLKGGSLSRNSPHLEGFLLATVAMAVATRTL